MYSTDILTDSLLEHGNFCLVSARMSLKRLNPSPETNLCWNTHYPVVRVNTGQENGFSGRMPTPTAAIHGCLWLLPTFVQ